MKHSLSSLLLIVALFGAALACGVYASMRAEARVSDPDPSLARTTPTTRTVTLPDSASTSGGVVRRDITEFKSTVKGVWLRTVPRSKEKPHDISIAGG